LCSAPFFFVFFFSSVASSVFSSPNQRCVAGGCFSAAALPVNNIGKTGVAPLIFCRRVMLYQPVGFEARARLITVFAGDVWINS
jgi:hypothetical protein